MHRDRRQNSAPAVLRARKPMESSAKSAMARKLHFACALHKHTHAWCARLPRGRRAIRSSKADYELEQPSGRDHAHCSKYNDIKATRPGGRTRTCGPGSDPGLRTGCGSRATPVPNKGDTAWMLTSTAIVLFMAVPGLALFYGGLVRSKNMLSVLMQVFVGFSLISVLWCIYGYSLAFTTGNAFIGGSDRLFLKGIFDSATGAFSLGATFSKATPMYEIVFVAFQATFAAITALPDHRLAGGAREVLRASCCSW